MGNFKNKIRYEGKNFDDLQNIINDFFCGRSIELVRFLELF